MLILLAPCLGETASSDTVERVIVADKVRPMAESLLETIRQSLVASSRCVFQCAIILA